MSLISLVATKPVRLSKRDFKRQGTGISELNFSYYWHITSNQGYM